jgi:hypothetical protein
MNDTTPSQPLSDDGLREAMTHITGDCMCISERQKANCWYSINYDRIKAEEPDREEVTNIVDKACLGALFDLFQAQAALRDREARQETANAAIELVNQYSIHIPKGQPKGTLARLNLNKGLAKLSQPQGGQANAY